MQLSIFHVHAALNYLSIFLHWTKYFSFQRRIIARMPVKLRFTADEHHVHSEILVKTREGQDWLSPWNKGASFEEKKKQNVLTRGCVCSFLTCTHSLWEVHGAVWEPVKSIKGGILNLDLAPPLQTVWPWTSVSTVSNNTLSLGCCEE